MQVAAVILAAGESRRLGQPKQLLRIAGETLLARMARLAAQAGASPVFAVLGAQFESMQAELAVTSARAVFNPRWQSGLSSSVHAGVDAVESQAPTGDGILLMNCDQPHLDVAHLLSLLVAFNNLAGQGIAASTYAGVRGVPAIFPRGLYPQLKLLSGDKGARALLVEPVVPLVLVQFVGGEIDIDTPSDLARLG